MICINNLSKSYGKRTILKGVNIVFPEHHINFILGKNGAGKTTLFKCILELEKFVGTIDTGNSRIYCIYDEQPFYPNLSGLENIELYKMMYNIKDDRALRHTILPPDTLKDKVKNYSYGQRKKLALIIAELVQPDIILLDEASNGLDYETIKYLKKQLSIWKQHLTVLITGHQLDFYNAIVDAIFVLKEGAFFQVEKQDDQKLEDIYEEYL